MSDALRLMFGIGPKKQQQREPRMQAQNEEGTERVMLYDDTSMGAVAARHNAAAIYGQANVPATFGMRPVVEVKDAGGNWVPVSGNSDAVPDVETQIAYLRNFRETGQIGVTPVAPDAIAGQAGELPGAERTDQQAAQSPALSYGSAMPMVQMPANFALGTTGAEAGRTGGQGKPEQGPPRSAQPVGPQMSQMGMLQLPQLAMIGVPPGLQGNQNPQVTSDEAGNVPRKPRAAGEGSINPNGIGGGGALQMMQFPDMLGRGMLLL